MEVDPIIDDELVKAYEYGNYTRTIENQKEVIRLKAKAKLHYATNGGLFCITPELILFAKLKADSGISKCILLDKNENPIMIENPMDFYYSIKSREQEVMDEMYAEYSKLTEIRDLKDL